MNMGTPLPIWEAGLLAGLAATAIDFAIARLMARILHVPATFAPFTILPIASGGLGGAMGATGVYALLIHAVPHPLPMIGAVTALVLLASILLPLRLLKSRPRRTNRFDGATPAVVIILVGLHTIVALCSLYAIHFWYRGG
jgi:hypothetical protein